ncbi:hypothetical protein [Streptomyces cyslabdanicus]|uniref:hypothetical protein n=1 Tax=Streptomyces cyslabdanicus TaxID=1470456 RepID=UPI00404439C9
MRALGHPFPAGGHRRGNSLTEGLDLVVEGTAEQVADPALLEEVIAAYGFGRDNGVYTRTRWRF